LFVRFQSPAANARGVHPGVFALVNGLAASGLLTEEEERFRRSNNDWFSQNFTDPSEVDALVYDREVNPGATAWFALSSPHLVERVDGYLAILDRHDVPWERVESATPGRIIYEDADQVVVVPVVT